MGFFDRIRKGKLFFGKKEPAIIVQFQFRGKTYILEEFDLDFRQDLNDKNRPDGDVYGGLITLTISETPDNLLTAWMMKSFEKQSGTFRFLINQQKILEGAAMQLSFEDAYCISYQQVMNPQGAGLLTTLIISPRVLKIGNETFDNKWK